MAIFERVNNVSVLVNYAHVTEIDAFILALSYQAECQFS